MQAFEVRGDDIVLVAGVVEACLGVQIGLHMVWSREGWPPHIQPFGAEDVLCWECVVHTISLRRCQVVDVGALGNFGAAKADFRLWAFHIAWLVGPPGDRFVPEAWAMVSKLPASLQGSLRLQLRLASYKLSASSFFTT